MIRVPFKKKAGLLVITIIGVSCLISLKPQYFLELHKFRRNYENHFEEETSNISGTHLVSPETFPEVPPSLEKEQTRKQIFKNLMKKRQNDIRKHCQKQKKQYANPQLVYYIKKDSLLWCPVFKAASTHVMQNMRQVSGKNKEDIKKIQHPPNSLLATIKDQENFTSLLVVRHPFNRLVSAFRDKLERCHWKLEDKITCDLARDFYYVRYGKTIVQRYRAPYIAKFGKESLSKEHNLGAPFPVIRSQEMPTWWEFVQSLLHSSSPSSWDEHYRPTSIYCTPCSFNFNTVLKFEQLKYEEGLLRELVPWGDKIQERERWENSNTDMDRDKLTAFYFSQLEDDEVKKLASFYRDDFIMFGYSYQNFLKNGR